ncbi:MULTISPECIES: ComEA family DNA-binding protein [Cobetia]|uniref:ComEA family DNA-binding protein n=1 Tax=Cobetia TaxID=204286 RepID=UPI000A053F48|nr:MULTISPECIES: helix-hairpin-helix domain-containing protein [Cobetia]MBS4152389.1 helix-hairpin-helix domain-containing protein [Cobetia sp. MC34]MDH2294884.1 helix-hairpin-helix domain-containing protein [Cobetia sp. 1AS1]MDH2420892.1 helix-hairpin-helix domain-containing protein [Cobetia litoralis]|tara:strand:+ start:1692 stop:2147 length:456 start_codon:yes stop_codon:yes gene_type:complete
MKTLLGTLLVTSLLVLSPTSQAADMNINTATAAQLTELKGIGGKKAQAIIEWRKANGPFTDVAQLTEIKGIGPNTLKRMNTTLTLGEPGKTTSAINTKSPSVKQDGAIQKSQTVKKSQAVKKSQSIDKTTTGKAVDSHKEVESLKTASNNS